MQTLVTGNNITTPAYCKQRCDTGYSLVEVVVVMALLALLSGLVVLNLPPSDSRRTEDAADALAAQLKLASDAAILSGGVTGLQLAEKDYRFLTRTLTGWQPLEALDRRSFIIPEGLTPSLKLDGEDVPLPLRLSDSVQTAPTLYFTAGGDNPAFTVQLQSRSTSEYIDGQPGGIILRRSEP